MNAQHRKQDLAEAKPLAAEGPAETAKSDDGAKTARDEATTAAPSAPPAAAPTPARKKRGGLRRLLIVSVPLVLAVAGAFYWVTGGRFVETDDAYVHQDRVTVMPQVSGQIAKVDVAENQAVGAGEVLFTIDDSAYRAAVEQEKANLESARLTVEKLKAAYQQAVVDAQTMGDSVATAKATFDRQQALVKHGVSSQSTFDDARLALQKAQGDQASAEQAVISAKAALAGDPKIPTDQHPTVMQALAALHSAQLDLDHTVVRASEPGVVSQTDRLQVGQYVTPSMSVMAIVEADESWVDANYKETDLTHMRPGQPVTLTFDAYPDVSLEGTVGSIGAGTGSEFALLPAQNATGNWVKVVQRIPVRIHIEKDAQLPPLRAGMSADVTVDTGEVRGFPDFMQPVTTALGLERWVRSENAVAATRNGDTTLAATKSSNEPAATAAPTGGAAGATRSQ
ncbi:HlyD family secretion protein [Jiella pacifica]|uniref:HlyD family efflux transporter periplasmic adaptor subunit n=1 Tax=Jiella pacifica TaxID=2696469 RepID=A0A6N9SYU5_9HYPH|nr:HlyD family secretion protein [Jiella pacifica]NDW04197.1 HlyD family efflux transporter periplasmic adaptor subunit [Jiella pacifica]